MTLTVMHIHEVLPPLQTRPAPDHWQRRHNRKSASPRRSNVVRTTRKYCVHQGRPQQVRGPMQDLGAGPSDQWCYYVIVASQPCSDLFDEDILAKW